ncbi:MAG TPA: carbamoyltransferase, partial [bacterium]|nr:carbamoyltransferase [bacterium]
VLNYSKLKRVKYDNPAPVIAEKLAEGKIVALFQGKMELGARALGNRSILANPLLEDTKGILNDHVKHRENWRPFCPSILEEYGNEFFEHIVHPGYMVVATKVRDEKVKLIPSAVHVDGTARPQFVSQKTNPYFWKIIEEFRKITDVPVIINTSFNIMGEPIINTPQEAIRCFFSTGIDILVLENYILTK